MQARLGVPADVSAGRLDSHGHSRSPPLSLRRFRFYTAVGALCLFTLIVVFLPGLVFVQTTATTIVTVTTTGANEGTVKDQASHDNELTFTIKVDRPATSTRKPSIGFLVDWNIDRGWHSDRNHRSGAATLTGPAVPNYVHEHGDVDDPVVTTSGSAISKLDSSACSDEFCGRFRVYFFSSTTNAESATATIDMKTISDRFQEMDESVRVNFTLKSEIGDLGSVTLKDAPSGARHSKQVEATITDDDHELPKITIFANSADGRDGRGAEGDSGTGTDFGAMLVFFRPDAECRKRTIADVDWRVTNTSTATSSGPFRDFTGPTSGTIRFDLKRGNPDGPGETGCAQTKRLVLKTVPDLWAEGNEEVTLSFSVRDSFPGALLQTVLFPQTPADAPRRNAIVKPYIADDEPEAGVVTITPSVPKGSSLVEGTSFDKTSGGQVDFTVTVHRPPPSTLETTSNTNWTLGWRFPAAANEDVDLKGHSEFNSVPIAEETRDIWAREPQVTRPPIGQYNARNLTLGFPPNSGKAERTLTMEVNPDDLVEGAEMATLRFSLGSGLIGGKSLSLPGGAAHADFSYTIANDDVPAGRIFVEAPAEGTVVTEGSYAGDAGEIRLTLTAHRTLAEAAQASPTIRKFRYTIESTSTATAGDDFTVGGNTGATGDITFDFQRGEATVEQDLVIAISPDQIHESRESIVLKLDALDGSFPDGDDADSDPDKTVTFTYHIEDDDLTEWRVTTTAPGTIREGTGTGSSDGNTAQIMVTAYRSQAASAVGRSYSFRWEVVSGESTATTGGGLKDHSLTASGTLPVTFGPGHIRSRGTAFDLTTIPDFAVEADEKLVIRLRTPRGDDNFRFVNGKKQMTVEVTILDDDESTGTIEVTAPPVEEGSGDPLTFSVRGTRRITTERRLDVGTVAWQLLDSTSTATRGTDFTTSARSGTVNLSFPSSNANATAARTFTMTVTDDEIPEGTETVAVRLRKGNDGFHFPDADGDGYPDQELIVLGRIVDDEEGTTTVTIRSSSYNGEGNDITFTVTASKQPEGNYPTYTNPRSTGVLHWELIPETAAFSPTNVAAGYKTGEDFKFKSMSSETADQETSRPANDLPTYTKTLSNGRLTGKMDLVMPYGSILETHEIKFATHVDGLVEQAERFTVRFWLDDADIGDLMFPESDAGERSEILVSTELRSKERADVKVPSAVSVTEGEDVVVEMSLARQLTDGESATLTFNAMRGGVGGSCGAQMAQQHLDYVPVPTRTLTWRNGERTKRIAITTIGDARDNADKCFQIVWVTGGGGLEVKGSQVHSGSSGSLYYTNVTIEDDDDPPVLYAKDAYVLETDEGEMPNLRFAIGLNTPTNKQVQVSYALDTSNTTAPNSDYPDAAIAGVDFVASTAVGTVTFEPGEVRKHVDVQVTGDYTEEENEWLRLKFAVMGQAAVTFDGMSELVVVGFIRDDDDELELSITLDDPRVQEGEDAVYRLHLSHPITRSLDVQVVAKDGTATAGSDYDAGGWSFSVPSGETEATIAIPTTEDGISGEGAEKFSVSVSNILLARAAGPKEYRALFGSDYTEAALKASIKAPEVEILDGPSVSIVPVYPEGQVEGMPQLFEARLSEPVARDITVTVKSKDPLFDPSPDFQPGLGYRKLTPEFAASSLQSDRDYTALPDAGKSMTIPAGETSSPRFSLATVDDGIDEWAERFIVYITESSGMRIDENLAVGIIRDNDARPTISISDTAAVTEGDDLSFEVTLSAPSQKTVTVQWHTEDDTAIAAEGDYEAASLQTLTFKRFASTFETYNGSKPIAPITVTTLNDETKEGAETLRVVLSQAPEAKSGTLTATGQILDDDDRATLTIEDAAPVAEASGAAAQFTVRLRRPQSVPVTVQWSTVEAVGSGFDAAQTGGESTWGRDDFTPISDASLTFSPGETMKTISVDINEDARGEATEYFLVKLTGDTSKVRFERDTARGYIEDPNALRIWLSDETLRYIRDGIPEGSGGKTGSHYTTTVDTPVTLTLRRTPIPQDEDAYHEKIRTLSCFREMATDGRSATLHPEQISAVNAGAFDIADSDAADVLFQARRFEANRSLQCQTRYEVLWPLYQNWDSGVWELAIPLAIPQDTRKEKDESFTVQVEFFSAPKTLRRTALPDFVNFGVTFTIVDDDSNKVSLDFAPASASDGTDEDGLKYKSVPEGAGAMLRVSTSEPVPTLQTVSIITRTETAEPGVDFAYAGASEVIIRAGQSHVDVPISVLDDLIYEEAESFVLELVNESDGIAIHTPQDAVRVKIPEDLPTLYVVPDVTVDEGEAATLTFRFDQPLRTDTTVAWYFVSPGVPNRATAGTHYVDPGGNTVAIPAGEISKSITISTLDNGKADGDWLLGVVARSSGGLGNQYYHPGYELHVSHVTIRDTGTRSVAFSEAPDDVSMPEGVAYDLPQPEVSVQPPDKPVFFSLAGADASHFHIHPITGVITVPVLHHTAPKDAGTDNTYKLKLQVTDEDGNQATTDISVTVEERPLHIEPATIAIAEKVVTTDGDTTTEAPGSAVLTVYPAAGSIREGEEVVITLSAKEDAPAYTLQRTKGNAGDPQDDGSDATTELTYTFANRNAKHEVTVTAVDDEIANDPSKREGVIVITVKGGGYLETQQFEVPVSVTDDDQKGVFITPTELTLVEKEDVEYAVVLTSEPTGPVQVKLTGIPNTGIRTGTGRDAQGELVPLPPGNTLTFTTKNWNEPQRVVLHQEHRPNSQFDSKFTVTHEVTGGGYASVEADDVAVTVVNIDAALDLIRLRKVDEGNELEIHLAFNSHPNGAPRDYELTWSTADDPSEGANQAVAGVDYTAVTDQVLAIGKGDGIPEDPFADPYVAADPIILRVQTTQDLMDEDDETFSFTFKPPEGLVTPGDGVHKGTIKDDDDAPTVSVADASAVAEGNDPKTATDMTFTVTLSAASSREITVDYTLGGTATAGEDYTDPETKTITIAAGETEGSIVIPVLGDVVDEPNETITVTLTNPTNATLSTTAGDTEAMGTITDDDAPAVTIADASAVAEGNDPKTATDMTFTVTLSAASSREITVDYTLGGTATAGEDYTDPETKTITIAAGETEGSIVIPVLGDVVDEPNETITVTLTNPTNATLGSLAEAMGTITDDDDAPAVSVSDASAVMEGNDPKTATDMTFTVTLSAASSREITVDYTLGGTATAGEDYTDPETKTITIAAGETEGSIVIPVLGDVVDENDETITVTLTNPMNATLSTTAGETEAMGTITDDDASPTVTIADASAVEEGDDPSTATDMTFTVTLSAASGRGVSVDFTLGGTATAGSDYIDPAPKALTIAAGKTTGSIEVPILGDLVHDPGETIIVTLTNPSHATLGAVVSATGSITDDDTAPSKAVLSVSPSSVAEGAGATTVTVTATLGGSVTFDADKTVAVSVGKDGDAAVSGVDYTGVSGFNITITAGQSSGQETFTLTPEQDSLDEDNEKLTVHATAAGLTISDAEVSITDDDLLPTVSVGNAGAVVEGDDPGTATDMTFTVSLSVESGRAVSVGYTLGGTATAGEDYTDPVTKIVTIAAGETEGSIVVAVLGDVVDEGNETVTVTLSSPSNATLGTAKTATGTITDDDERGVTLTSRVGVAVPAGGLTVHEVDKAETEDAVENVVSYEVGLASKPTGTVTITVTSGDATVATVSPKTLRFTPSDWDAQTVTVTAVDDDVDNTGDQRKTSVAHAVTSMGNDYDDQSVGSVAVTVTDDEDTPTASLVLTPSTITESGETNTSTVTGSLSGKSDRAVTVEVASSDSAAVTLTANKTLSFAAGATTSTGTVTATAVDNNVHAANATVTVSGVASGGGVGNPPAVTLTITDDDTAPTTAGLSTSPTSVAEGAGATTVTVTATLAGSSTFNTDKTVAVSVGKNGDTAVSGVDYTGVSGFNITITAGELSGQGSFSLAPEQDSLDEDTESLTVHATAGGLTISDATVSITDDDASPTVTIADATATEGDKAEFTVTLSAVSGRDVTVEWTTGDDGSDGAVQATADTDYTAQTTAQTLTIAAGSATGSIEVQTTEDTVAENTETFTVTLASPTNATLGAVVSATGSITDDDTAPSKAVLSVSPSSVAEGAGATTVTVTATLGGSVTFDADKTVAVSVGKDGDAAVSGVDYTGVSGFNITITAGQSSGQETFTLTPEQDSLDEDNEKLTVHATAAGLTISDAEVSITDDDLLPTVSVGNAGAVVEGDDPGTATDMTFTVSLSVESGRAVSVGYTLGGTATAGEDYTDPVTKIVTIAAGETEGSIVVAVLGDVVDEGNETVTVTLSSPSNATLGTAKTATGTITDDDERGVTLTSRVGVAVPAGGLTVHEVDKAETEDAVENVVSYEVGLASKPTGTVTITVTSGDATVATVSPKTLRFTPSDWDAQTVTVTAVDDDVDNTGDQRKTSVAHAVTSMGNDYDDQSVGSVAVTVTDDEDTPTASLVLTPSTITESGETNTSTVTGSLSGKSDRAVTVEVASSDSAAVTLTANKTLSFAAGATTSTGTVTATAVDNNVHAANATVTVSGVASGGGVGNPPAVTLTITDDDTAPTTAGLSTSPTSVAEGAGATTVTVTATLAGSSTFNTDKTVAVSVGKNGDTAVSGVDYTGVSGFNITITAGELSGQGSFSLAPEQDSLDEDTESLTVHATAGGLTISDATVSITDDDASPTVTIADATATEGDKAEFTVTLSAVSGRDVTVEWTTGDDGSDGAVQATADTDYTAQTTAQTLTIAAGSATGSIEVQTTEDTVAENTETFTVTLASPTNATLGAVVSATGSITDDDTAPSKAVLSVSPSSVAEGAGATTVTVTATLGGSVTFDADKTVAVSVGKDGDAAVSGVDYTGVSGFNITITAGQSSGQETFTLTPEQDSLDEDNEKLTVHATAAGLTISDATMSITDDDTASSTASLSVSPSSVAEGAGGTTVTVTATLGGSVTFDADKTVAVSVGKNGDTAVSGTDYTGVSDFDITITGGQSSGQETFTLTPEQDSLDEDTEKLTVHATAAGLTISDTTVTITDDDPLPELTIGDASVAEGGKVVFTVTLDAVSGRDVTVEWTTGDDGTQGANQATADTDYTAQSSAATLTIAASSRTGTIEVQTTEDTIVESTETFTVTLASPTHATLGAVSSATGSITDDDTAPSTAALSVSPSSVAEGAGGTTVTVTATLAGSVTLNVDTTVAVSVGKNGDTAVSGTDYTGVNGFNITITAGQLSGEGTFSLAPEQDSLDEGNEKLTVHATAAGLTISDATVTITDDDEAPSTASLSVSPTSVAEGAGATTVTVTATLAGSTTFNTDKTVAVKVGKNGDTAVSGTDYTGVSDFDITITGGQSSGQQTFTLTPEQDSLDEGNEKLTVHATAAGLTISDAEVTVTDDDPPPTVTVGNATATEGDKAEFTVTLGAVSGRDVTVEWTTGDDSTQGANQATADTDYTAQTTAQTLTIAAGSATGTIEVQTTEDTIAENTETFTVTLASPTHATLGTAKTATGTITDDDTASTTAALSVSPTSVGEGAGGTTVTVQATLAGSVTFNTDKTVAVKVGKSGDQAVSDTDYTGVSDFDVTITAGQSSGQGTFTLMPTQDTLSEGDEKLTVHATATGLTISDADVTITDDDAPPTLSVSDAAPVTEGDTAQDSADMTFVVSLSSVSGKDVTVSYALGGTATAGSDYTAPDPLSLTIPAGSQQASIVIPIIGDTLVEGDETVTVTLNLPSPRVGGRSVPPGQQASGTIQDNDTQQGVPSSLVLSPAIISEGGGNKGASYITARLSEAVDDDVTFTVAAAPLNDTTTSDFRVSTTRVLTIKAGDLESKDFVTIAAVDNDRGGPDKTVRVSATVTGTAQVAAPEPEDLTITDDDLTGRPDATVAFQRTAYSLNEDGRLDIAVILDTALTTTTKVRYLLHAPDSVVGRDGDIITRSDGPDGWVSTEELIFAAGDTRRLIRLLPVDDNIVEPDEEIAISLLVVSGQVRAGSPTTVTLTDDDRSVLYLRPTYAEVEEGEQSRFRLRMQKPHQDDVTVELAVSGTAQAGEDFATLPATLTIPAGGQTADVAIPTVADEIPEGTETLVVSLANVVGQHVTIDQSAKQHTLLIRDPVEVTPPTAVTLSVSPASVAENAGATRLTLTAAFVGSGTLTADTSVSVTVGKAGDVAIYDADYTVASTVTVSIPARQSSGETTFTLTPTDDALTEGSETLTLHGTATGLVVSDTSVTITDDDSLPELTIADASVVEGGKAQFTVTLGEMSVRDVTVQWTTGDDGAPGANQATAGTDYTALTTAQTLTIAAGSATGRIEVQTTEDSIAEDAETFTVTLASPTNAILGASITAKGTITDDDTALALVALSVSPTSVGEGAGATTVTVTATLVGSATLDVDQTITVKVGKDGDVAISDTDYTGVSDFGITIEAAEWSSERTFTLTPTPDTLNEGDESLTVHGIATGLTIFDATVTITDDDRKPQVRARSLAVARFDSTAYTLNEDGSPVEMSVLLSRAQTDEVELTFTMTSPTAQIGRTGDVWALSNGPVDWRYDQKLIFAPGETRKTVRFFPVDDNLVEPDEWVTVSLSVVSGDVTAGPSTILKFTDDDLATVLLLPTQSQANEGERAVIQLRLNKPHQQDITMACFVRGTATPGVDYAALPHRVVIPAGSQTALIPVEVLRDEIAEGPETLVFIIAHPSRRGVVISPEYSEHTVTIIDVTESSQAGNGQ